MLNIIKSWSMVPKSLRYKLLIAFSLMSVIPLLVLMYLLYSTIFPYVQNINWISWVVLLSIIIALLGLAVAKGIVDPILQLAIDARVIARGQIGSRVEVKREDEIGDLGEALNQITHRIRENMDELKSYSEKTKEINLEINKKVLALSGLLQIGNLISTSVELTNVLKLILDKVIQIDDARQALLFIRSHDSDALRLSVAYSSPAGELKDLAIKEGEGALGRMLLEGNDLIADKNHPPDEETRRLLDLIMVKTLVAVPIALHGRVEGLLISGTDKEFHLYEASDVDLLRVFSKQVAVSVENDFLNKKAQELQIKDELTGLYNQHYIRQRLNEEIKRAIACQRPCSFSLFDIDNFTKFRDEKGELSAEGAIRNIAQAIKESISEIDRAARYGDDAFAIILPEKNKKETIRIANKILKKVGELSFGAKPDKLTISAGLSENPLDGKSANELIDCAEKLLIKAKKDGKNRVEV